MTRLRKGQAYCELEVDGLTLVRHSGGGELPPSTTRSFYTTPAEADAALEAALDAAMADGFVPLSASSTHSLTSEGGDVMIASPQLFDCTGRHGRIEAVRFIMDHSVRRGAAPELEAFLSLPAARELEALRIGVLPSIKHRYPTDEEKDYAPLVATLARERRPTLQKLALVEEFEGEEACFTSLSGIVLGDVEPLYAAVPQLRALALRANNTLRLGVVALAELRDLTIETDDGFSAAMLQAVSRLRCPKLERLELRFGHTEHSPAELAPLLTATMPPSLTHVGLSALLSNALCGAIARAKFLPQLTTLALCGGKLDDAGARELIRHRAAFAHLESLDLEGNQVFGGEERDALEAALPNVGFGMQIKF